MSTTDITDAPGERRITPGLAGLPDEVDLVVIGLGVTGAGVALDAVTRGLSVLALDAHDLAFGTSRWSSKLVHGGLRYLAAGQIGVAHESAVERGILMGTTAPHLVRRLPTLLPLGPATSRLDSLLGMAGLRAGDVLRRVAGTPSSLLPAPHRVDPVAALRLGGPLRTAGLRGALLGYDGQLVDDARLVATIARTAARQGAEIRTRAKVLSAAGTSVIARDAITGTTHGVRARAVVNATGVWAGEVDPSIRLRPSRGTHLVLRAATLPGLRAAVFAQIPGRFNRFVLVLPQPDGLVYVGLTDEPLDGPIPDVPEPTDAEIDFLLSVVSQTFDRPIRRDDVVGAYAGLRPLLDGGAGSTADLSRRHATVVGESGVVTIVGGKLTTYRRMAQDAVDTAVTHAGIETGPCVTATLPLSGAAARAELDALARAATSPGQWRLVRRYGSDAALVLDSARGTGLADTDLLSPIATGVPTTLAELLFGITHEGAADVEDLLDRRTRVGLVPADRALAVPAAERALTLAGR